MKKLTISFSPVDSWFFREAKPIDAVGGGCAESVFPPPVNTLIGCVRSRLGDALGVDWVKFNSGSTGIAIDGIDAKALIGEPENTGQLKFSPLRLQQQDDNGVIESLYPAPAILMQTAKSEGEAQKVIALEKGNPVHCDLGNVCLPQLPNNTTTAKPLENSWLTEKAWQKIGNGQHTQITPEEIFKPDDLFDKEPRLGIARNNQLGTVEQGMLYQTEHLRLKQGISIAIDVELPEQAAEILAEHIKQNPLQRFGGEGRMCELSVAVAKNDFQTPVGKSAKQLMLVLLSDALFQENNKQPLPGFIKHQNNDGDYWCGEIAGVGLRLDCVVAGKAVRRGGWDLKNRKPKAIRSYMPAGSCFFITPHPKTSPEMPLSEVINALNTKHIGQETDFGYGKLICIAL